MKILNINRFYYQRGGADAYFFLIADMLQKRDHTVIPFSTILDNNLLTPYVDYFVDGYSEDTVPALNISRKARIFFNGIYSLETKNKLRQLIKQEKPDLAHIHGVFYQLSLSVIDVLKEHKIPTIMALNDYFILCANGYLYRDGGVCELCKGGRYRSLLLHKCYRKAFLPSLMAYFAKKVQHRFKILNYVDRFTVPQDNMKNLMIEWGVDRNKISVLYNPFDAGKYMPNYTFEDYIVFYGRFVRLKGIFTILKAMGRLKGIKLKMFGFGPDYKEIERYILENKLDNVEIDSQLRWGAELIKIISNAKFVVSAPEWYTPSDYVVYESFSLGKPVVTSAVGGNLFLVKDGYNGLLFKPGDAVSLAKKIKELYTKDSLIVEMGKNARHFVENELNYEGFYEKLLSLYRQVLQSK